MSTSTSDKFNKIINCKEQIRKAINKKGSRVSPDVPLDQYATKINAIPFYEDGGDDGFAGFISDLLSLKTDASYLFYNPNSQSALATLNDESIGYLNKIGLSDTRKTNYMFANNNYIQTIGTLEFNQVTDCSYMFSGTTNLTNVTLNMGISGTQQYPLQYMFSGCTKLKDLNLRIRRTGNFSSATNTYYMFTSTSKTAADWESSNFYIDIDVPYLSLYNMFSNNTFTNLSFLKNTKIKCDTDSCSWEGMFNSCSYLTDIEFPEGCELPKPTSLSGTFGYTPLMQYNDKIQHFFDTIDLSEVSSMNGMFRMRSAHYCNFQNLNLTITLPVDEQSCSIQNMFDCSNSNYYMNESKITYFSFNGKGSAGSLFKEYGNSSSTNHGLRTVEELNLPYVTSFESLFYYCYLLTSIDTINSGDNLSNTNQMFYYCYNLIDVPVFNTSKVTNFKQMFQQCNKIKEIPAFDLGGVANTSLYSWNDSNNPYYNMMSGCSNLERFHCTNIKQSIDLSVSTKFTREALLEIIGNLYDISDRTGSTLYFHIGATNLAKLTAEDIALATAKGWTIN